MKTIAEELTTESINAALEQISEKLLSDAMLKKDDDAKNKKRAIPDTKYVLFKECLE